MGIGTITASQVLFIKLGAKGDWEQDCIEGSQPHIQLGFRSNQHQECLAGNWDAVLHYWSTTGGKDKGEATKSTNVVKAFYTADEQTIWITFYKRKLWWCFASRKIEELPDGNRIRRTLAPWSCKDCLGKNLLVESLSGELTKVRGFRGTVCTTDKADYLLGRLNGIYPEEVRHAQDCLGQLESALRMLIPKLGWKDFELLCDLIFTQAGWQRISSLGKTEKTIDMELLSPVNGKRAAVQVKSKSDLQTFLKYKQQFDEIGLYDEVYFVVHKPTDGLAAFQAEPPLFLLTAERLAKLVVSSGLSEWLIQKTQ